MVIILHAPADPEVNSVDEILSYATQPGESQPSAHREAVTTGTDGGDGIHDFRLLVLPFLGGDLLVLHDHQGRTQIRPEGSHGILVHLFAGRKRVRHGHQGGRLVSRSMCLGEQLIRSLGRIENRLSGSL